VAFPAQVKALAERAKVMALGAQVLAGKDQLAASPVTDRGAVAQAARCLAAEG